MGRRADDGSFEQFMLAIRSAKLRFRGMNVDYTAPGIGSVRFGWNGSFCVNGKEVPLRDYPRYANVHLHAEFDPREIHLFAGGHELHLSWTS
jgi:hypothetical protein